MTGQERMFGPGGAGDPESVTVEGVVQRVVFSAEDTGYTVLRLRVDGEPEPVTAVGPFPRVSEGETLRVTGRWTTHARFGRQLQAESVLPVTPSTVEGVRRYLGSGLVPGIGPSFAARLVEHFGADTLDVIERDPDRLREVPGIGPKRVARLRAAWAEQAAARDVMVFLESHGISPAYAARIHRRYGAKALDVLRENPYRLAADVAGIGFRRADEIARRCGIAADSPLRARAGLLYLLAKQADDGHTATPRPDLIAAAARELEIRPEALEESCAHLVDTGRVIADGVDLALAPLHEAERRAAELLRGLQRGAPRRPRTLAAHELDDAERRCGIRLGDSQRRAVTALTSAPVAVLTGGPGTGKTTCLRVLLAVCAARNQRVLLAAPTGRAAKRMAEATGQPASTLHRLLAYQPRDGLFHRNAERPLKAAVVVVDEVSMVDVLLLRALLEAVAPPTRLLLVGDADQLPSVGPGQVLADVIRSGRVVVSRLDTIYRQDEASGIVRAAHAILAGRWPRAGRDAGDDYFFVRREDSAEAAALVVELVARRIPDRFGLDPVRDVQVLTPMHRGTCGSRALNVALRDALNPPAAGKAEIQRGSRLYRVGDRVMQTRNDYDREVFNGDMGRIVRIARGDDGEEVTVAVDGRAVVYQADALDALVPAFAVSIHKSQGSEYPAVVIPLLGEHWVMLRRNLLYTAITRGKRLVTVVGSNRAVGRAIGNAEAAERRTLLRRFLLRTGGGAPTPPPSSSR